MREFLSAVLKQHESIDRRTAALARRTGIACPTGCGACCLSPEVEASVIGVLPLARALVREGRAEAILAELERRRARGDARCPLYEPDPRDPRRGRCGAYAHRPILCRTFGFAARRDREGRLEFVGCREMRAAAPSAVAHAERHVRAGGDAVVLAEKTRAQLALAPGPLGVPRPIGEALGEALRRVLLERRLRAAEGSGEEPRERNPAPAPSCGPAPGGGGRPRRPRRPRRAA